MNVCVCVKEILFIYSKLLLTMIGGGEREGGESSGKNFIGTPRLFL